MLNAFWQAHTVMSPVGLATAAVDQYQRMEKDLKEQQKELTNLYADIGQLNIQIEGMSRLSLSLSRDQLLMLIESYLNVIFMSEGIGSLELRTIDKQSGFDGILNLPHRSVFVKLYNTTPDDSVIEKELETAKSLNPSEVWIFSYDGSRRIDIRLDPAFLGENRVIRGRFRMMPFSDLLKLTSGGKFTACVQSSTEDGNVRFLLTKNAQSAQ